MTLISLGNDKYKVRFILYRDVTMAPLPNSFEFNIYKNSDNTAAPTPRVTVNKISSALVVYSCKPNNAGYNVEKWIYESNSDAYTALNLTAFNSISGYYLSNSTCCRTIGVTSILNSGGAGITFTMDFPRLNSTAPTHNNSSPEFRNPPVFDFAVNRPYTLDFNVVDPNGDSLVFYTTKAYSEGTTIKPFPNIEFASGYKLDSNIADGAPDFTINKKTGIISYKPKNIGLYLIAIRVEEWKKASGSTPGYKIGEVRREFIIKNVVNYGIAPIITDKKNRVNLVRDTLFVKDTITYSNSFLSKKQIGDSLFIKLVPEQGIYNNIFNSNYFDVKFGKTGNVLSSGNSINNLVLKSKDSIKTNFIWKIDSTDIKKTPFKFKVITFDNSCHSPLADTLDIELYVLGQCYNNKQISLIGCDSVVDLYGRKYFKNAIVIDTLKSVLGCDTVLKQFISVKKSTKAIINTQGCDSVMAVDGKFYHQNTTINKTIKNARNCDSIITQNIVINKSTSTILNIEGCNSVLALDGNFYNQNVIVKTIIKNANNCDSIITQNIIVNKSPTPNAIRGDLIIKDVQSTYYYGTDLQNGIAYLWKVTNGNIISGQGTNVVEVKWLSNGIGALNCIINDNQTNCSDSIRLSITIATGINDIKNSNIKIYPNPTNNIINIEGLNKNENNTIQIFDVQGKLVITKSITEKGTIDLSELNKGVYVIKIGEVAQRIVKM
jgi:hypothetical protein